MSPNWSTPSRIKSEWDQVKKTFRNKKKRTFFRQFTLNNNNFSRYKSFVKTKTAAELKPKKKKKMVDISNFFSTKKMMISFNYTSFELATTTTRPVLDRFHDNSKGNDFSFI
jgi:hypothetical protein